MTTLVIVAHPDDEAFGPAGTIARLTSSGERVVVISLCKGDRPGAEHVSSGRVRSFRLCCEMLGAEWKIFSNSDVLLEEREAATTIETMIRMYQPEVVYTHSFSDLHRDHRIVAQAVLTACRPKPESSVMSVLTFEIPGTTEWSFGSQQPFEPNVFVDVSEFMDIKRQAIALYSTETYDFPDARSVESVEIMAKNRGKQCGFTAAEAFQLIYARVHKTL